MYQAPISIGDWLMPERFRVIKALASLTDLLAQVGLGSAIILMAYANKNASYAIKMMALPREF